MKIAAALIGWCLALFCSCAMAQANLPARYLYPKQGFWVPDGSSLPQERNSYSVQVGPDGYVFVAIYTYDTAGEPTFLTMQGELQPGTLYERTQGLRSKFESPLYRTRGGTPLVSTLPAAPQTVLSSFGTGYLRFFLNGKGEFQLNGKIIPIKPFEAFVDPAAMAPETIATGLWSFAIVGSLTTNLQTVSVARQPTQYHEEATGYSGLPPGDIQYRFSCLACAQMTSSGQFDPAETEFARQRLDRLLLSYDRRTDQWRLHSIRNNRYTDLQFAVVSRDEITVYLTGAAGTILLNRLPEALRNPYP